ncbi:helix-turn-helix transcriptional regulator [Chishuiella sp.]|uniref:helix-turn-helix transcriptional regulator n=1 Tax=Chishuiella sp. TaxID=1969467 RepID=UPI0028A7BBDB|nr:helix-turn-helix transcriptional regulator [Chishuiella sp.]
MENLDKIIDSKIKEISNKLKELRISKGYTSYETFAFENELNRVQYWRIESGHNITLKTLIKVLKIHEKSLEEFFKDL